MKRFGIHELFLALGVVFVIWGFMFSNTLHPVLVALSLVAWVAGAYAVLNHFDILDVINGKPRFGTFKGLTNKEDILWLAAPLLVIAGLILPWAITTIKAPEVAALALCAAFCVIFYSLYTKYIGWPEAVLEDQPEAQPAPEVPPEPASNVTTIDAPKPGPTDAPAPRPRRSIGGGGGGGF